MQKGYKSLSVYQKAFELAIAIHKLSFTFPKEEKYSLTDQIRRSSRSVCSNITEGYRKRRYPKHLSSKATDAYSECSETVVWLDFSLAFGYISTETHEALVTKYDEVEKLLSHMERFPEKYAPRNPS